MVDENFPQINQSSTNQPPITFGNKKRVILIVVAIVLALAVVSFLVMYFYNKSRLDKNSISTTSLKNETALKEQYNKNLQQTFLVDKDFDGILDSEEVKYGTSSTSSDTDSDGILDRDEINIYKTNPLKADTDGDGYNDGYEVRRGYNPKGAGTL